MKGIQAISPQYLNVVNVFEHEKVRSVTYLVLCNLIIERTLIILKYPSC